MVNNKAEIIVTDEAKRLAEQPYSIIIYLEHGVHVARHPELPGCQTHGGGTKEVVASLDKLRPEWIQCLLDDGEDVPGPEFPRTVDSVQPQVYGADGIESEHLAFIEGVMAMADNAIPDEFFGGYPTTQLFSALDEIFKSCQSHLTKHKQSQQPEGAIEDRYIVFGYRPNSHKPSTLHTGDDIEYAICYAIAMRDNYHLEIVQLWDSKMPFAGYIDLDLYIVAADAHGKGIVIRGDKGCPGEFLGHSLEMEKILEARKQPECPGCLVVEGIGHGC